MEVELKYMIGDAFSKEKLLEDSHLNEIKDDDSEKTIVMNAVYFDTDDFCLKGEKIGLRCRAENDKYIATVKWGGSSENGLHVRGEINVPVDEEFLNNPNVDIFEGSELYERMKRIIGCKKLQKIMEMDFVRREVRVDTGKSISVISVDEGVIRTAYGECPISEVEIELYSGNREDMLEMGAELSAKYNLTPYDESKLQRGFDFTEKRKHLMEDDAPSDEANIEGSILPLS